MTLNIGEILVEVQVGSIAGSRTVERPTDMTTYIEFMI